MFKDIKCSYKGKQTNISQSNMDTWDTLIFIFHCSTVIVRIFFVLFKNIAGQKKIEVN